LKDSQIFLGLRLWLKLLKTHNHYAIISAIICVGYALVGLYSIYFGFNYFLNPMPVIPQVGSGWMQHGDIYSPQFKQLVTGILAWCGLVFFTTEVGYKVSTFLNKIAQKILKADYLKADTFMTENGFTGED